MTGRLGLGASLAAAALLVAACAGRGTTTPAAAQSAAATQSTPAAATTQSTPAPTTPPAASIAAGCEVVTDGTGTAAEIKGFAFPAGLTVKAGEAIAWTNGDSASHTVTFDDGTCKSGTIAGGATLVVRYDTPGTYAFHCSIHSSMTGTIEVK
jgi:plastocyanin